MCSHKPKRKFTPFIVKIVYKYRNVSLPFADATFVSVSTLRWQIAAAVESCFLLSLSIIGVCQWQGETDACGKLR
jgi:hypothetical protein